MGLACEVENRAAPLCDLEESGLACCGRRVVLAFVDEFMASPFGLCQKLCAHDSGG